MYEKGTRIRVSLSVQVGQRTSGRQLLGTARVRETSGDRWTHFLYLGSSSVTGDTRDGQIVTAQFGAVVTGSPEANPELTTEVTEASGFTHFLSLNSPGITVLDNEAKEPPVPAATETPVLSEKRITPSAAAINSTDVINRIAQLEDTPDNYTIIRTKTGARLVFSITFTSEADALSYLDDRDYNVDRFTITPQRSAADTEELKLLRTLNSDGGARFGLSQWTSGVQLSEDGTFTEEWAQNEAIRRLKIADSSVLNEWPLSEIDWGDAAQNLLDAEYYSVTVGTETFWGLIPDTE